MAPLLEVRKLTMRFGGLTAVNDVTFAVEPGQIFSVIGPNGAGKTTVFNAVTAIYEPTEGEVLFEGADMKRPLGAKVVSAALAIGIFTAVFGALAASNPDKLWKATIKQNYRDSSKPFPAARAWSDFWSYMAGELKTELRVRRWHVVTYDSGRSLGSWADEAGALQALAALREMASLSGSDRTLAESGGRWVVRSADGSRELQSFATKAEALERIRDLGDLASQARTRSVVIWLAFFAGLILGSLGMLSVWRQARRTPHIVARHGLARTFQNIRLFPEMTVAENVLMGMDRHLVVPEGRWARLIPPAVLGVGILLFALAGAHAWLGAGLLAMVAAILAVATVAYIVFITRMGTFTPQDFRAEQDALRKALDLLGFVGLKDRAWELARSLPYGDMRRLEIARALATQPKLVLLDEPAAGMNPAESIELTKLITKIRDTGVTVILIEHHMKVVMPISDKIVVLEYGNKIAEGTPAEVKANPKVIEAYLGKEEVT